MVEQKFLGAIRALKAQDPATIRTRRTLAQCLWPRRTKGGDCVSSKSYNRGSAAISRGIWEDYTERRRLPRTVAYVPGVPLLGPCQHRRICFFYDRAVCQDCGGEAPRKGVIAE